MQETQIRSLGQEDPLEKGMATHFSARLAPRAARLAPRAAVAAPSETTATVHVHL